MTARNGMAATSRLRKPACAKSASSSSAAPIPIRSPRSWSAAVSASRDLATLATLRGPLAEEALGAEDEDDDQDREHHRLGPVAPRRVPAEPLVESLDQPDQQGPENGSGKVADAAEHRRREGDQPELEALVEADRACVERVEKTGHPGERAGDQEGERDRAVDVDAHHRGGVPVLSGRAHRLALARPLHEPDEDDQHGSGHEQDDELLPRVLHAPDREDVAGWQDV